MLQNIRKFLSRSQLRNVGLKKSEFENLPFKVHWNNYVKSFDLRMWYLENGVNDEKRMKCVHELETLHNELNYQWVRGLFKRYAIFYAVIMIYGIIQIKEYPIDWADRYDGHYLSGSYGDMGDSGGLEEEED